jgi:hypothetical protein
VRDDVSVNSDALSVTDFVNLKINSAHSFGWTHRDMIYVCVIIEISILYCIFKKEKHERREGSESSRPVHHSLCRGCLRTRRRQTRAWYAVDQSR